MRGGKRRLRRNDGGSRDLKGREYGNRRGPCDCVPHTGISVRPMRRTVMRTKPVDAHVDPAA